ncbi:hypothetical protein KC345_g10952, partial [Hortaea werneckii]
LADQATAQIGGGQGAGFHTGAQVGGEYGLSADAEGHLGVTQGAGLQTQLQLGGNNGLGAQAKAQLGGGQGAGIGVAGQVGKYNGQLGFNIGGGGDQPPILRAPAHIRTSQYTKYPDKVEP